MVEFAFVVVLLIALLYGIISYGLILAAQSTITQAAADGARAGIVASSTAPATAEAQACNDVGWMDKSALPLERQQHGLPTRAGSAITASHARRPARPTRTTSA